MFRRIALLVPLVMTLTLSGCIFLPGHDHHDHCCYRYDAR